jgi:hypothetical protein
VSRCKGCGGEFRKGKRRTILLPEGGLLNAIVCPKCDARSVAILVQQPPERPVKQIVIEGSATLNALSAQLKRMRANAVRVRDGSLTSTTDRAVSDGFVQGLDNAIAALDAAKEGRLTS